MATKTEKAAEIATNVAEQAQAAAMSENTIYLMGSSFIVGSLFTVFMLLVLDFMKRDRGIDK